MHRLNALEADRVRLGADPSLGLLGAALKPRDKAHGDVEIPGKGRLAQALLLPRLADFLGADRRRRGKRFAAKMAKGSDYGPFPPSPQCGACRPPFPESPPSRGLAPTSSSEASRETPIIKFPGDHFGPWCSALRATPLGATMRGRLPRQKIASLVLSKTESHDILKYGIPALSPRAPIAEDRPAGPERAKVWRK